MKKTILSICFLAATTFAFAQMTSKNGSAILPESGDWSVGIGANPFLSYFGNLMNGSNVPPSFDWTDGNANVITCKMMKDEKTAYRVKINLGLGSIATTEAADTTAGSLKDSKLSSHEITLGAGMQMYRGKGRVRGYYGFDGMISLGGGEKSSNNYNGTASAGSTLENKSGGSFGLGINGILGVEYFFAPKMSISGEYSWGVGYSMSGAGSTKIADGTGGSTTTDTFKSSSFGIGTDNGGGAINLNFYF